MPNNGRGNGNGNGNDRGNGRGNSNGGNGNGGNGGGGSTNTVRSIIRDLLNSSSSSPLSSQAGRREINAAARLRYGPLQRQQEAEIRASEAQTKRDKGYYQDYLHKVANLQQGTTGIYNDANAQLAQAQAAAGGQDTKLLGMIGAQRAGMQALTGAPSQAAALNPLAAAQASRGTDALNNQARTIGQGANQRSYMVDQRRIGQAAKAQALVAGGARTLSLEQQLSDLAREKGAFKADMLRENRDADRGFLIDLLSGPNARRYLKLQSEESRRSARLDDNLHPDPPPSSSSSSDGNGRGNGRGPDARDQRQENRQEAQDARALISDLSPPNGVSAAELAHKLIQKGIDPSVARRVAKQWAKKHQGGQLGTGAGVGAAGAAASGVTGGGKKGDK